MSYWVYIVACADDTYYTGVATDVPRRLAQHNGEKPKGARYTSARRPVTLVYQVPCATRSDAQKEEARIKALPRAEKLALIISARLINPQLAEAAAS
jgi:putative endonuclease